MPLPKYPPAITYPEWNNGVDYYFGKTATKIVTRGEGGDYNCDGVNDYIEVQAAINAVTQGTVLLKDMPMPDGVTMKANVLVIEVYNGKIRFFGGELKGIGRLENYFMRNGYVIDDVTYPQAIYYNGKTYVVFQGYPNEDPYITLFDHSTEQWATPVKIGTNPLTDDMHGGPAIMIDALGYIHVWFGSHSFTPGYMKYSRSTNAEDISTWTAQSNFGTNPTFPNVIKASNNDLYVFYGESVDATNVRYVYHKSTDNGANWGTKTTVIDFGATTGVQIASTELIAGSPNKIHLAWYYRQYGVADNRQNVYHAYLNLTDGKMYAADDTDLGASIDKTEADDHCLVFDSTGENVGFPRVRVASNGRPYIIFGDCDAGAWKFAAWTGAAWTVTSIHTADISMFERPDFIINSTSEIEAYLIVNEWAKPTYTGVNENGGNLWKFRSTDTGATWRMEESVYYGGNFVTNPKTVYNHNNNLKIIFSEPYIIDGVLWFNIKLKLYAHGDNGFVMKKYYWE